MRRRLSRTSRTTASLVLAATLVVGTLLPAAPAAAVTATPTPTIKNPDLYEKSLEVARRALDQYGPYEDPAELARVNDIGYRVARESGFSAYPLTFHTIDMPEPNAFALPGGHLFITRGMLQLGLDDDMLASLLGHEIAHVVLDHHAKMQRKATLLNVLGQALLVGVMIGADDDREYDPRDPHGNRGRAEDRNSMVQGAAAASVLISELLLRGYSREHEDQADAEGQRWAAAAGFDPDGANRLFALMEARIPQSKKYGYWRTHPFFTERVRSGKARAELLKVEDEPASADDFRARTQDTLLAWLAGVELIPGDAYDDKVGRVSRSTGHFLEDEALATWPRGSAADRIRLNKLHRLRAAEITSQRPVERDYGEVIRAYLEQQTAVAALTPENDFLELLTRERAALEAQASDLYPKAREILADDVFETPFLERFLSNWPDAPEVPRVALLLGDAHARLAHPDEAVRFYLRAMETAPESEEAKRAARGLKVMTPRLDRLAALERLAGQRLDAELAEMAGERLEATASAFADVDNGAEYMDRFPDGRFAEAVGERMNVLADKLYAEVLLYQAIGDHGKAVERINTILTYAPLSPAADLLRDRAVLEA